MITLEQAQAVRGEAQDRAERKLGQPIGSGLTQVGDGWAVKLYVQGHVGKPVRAGLSAPIQGVTVVVDEIGPVSLHGTHRRERVGRP